MPAVRPLNVPRLVASIAAAAALHATVAVAAERPANRTLAESARVSLLTAADRVVEGTREIRLLALSLVGIGYRYGGETPAQGLDCSGLIRYVFQQVTGVTLPRTAQALSHMGRTVSVAELEPGDLVFFNTRRLAFSHVGIYLGNDRFIHAPSRGGEVGVASLTDGYWQKRYNGARRLVGVLPSLLPSLITRAEATPLRAAVAHDEAAPSSQDEPAQP